MDLDNEIYWIEPIIVDGVARYPMCESECTSEQSRQYRESRGEDYDCLLSAKVSWRGRNLCQRHAAKLALHEMVKHRGAHSATAPPDVTREG